MATSKIESNGIVYSTTEQKIGSFNGKPLYSKIFTPSKIVTTQDTWVENTVDGTNDVWVVSARLIHSWSGGYYSRTIGISSMNANNKVMILDFRSNTIEVGVNANSIYLLMEYTKKSES